MFRRWIQVDDTEWESEPTDRGTQDRQFVGVIWLSVGSRSALRRCHARIDTVDMDGTLIDSTEIAATFHLTVAMQMVGRALDRPHPDSPF